MKWIRFRQSFPSPVKGILLFLLLAVTTALLTVSVALYQGASERIGVVESEFTTVGTVEQIPIATEYDIFENDCFGRHTNVYEVYNKILSPDILRFEGADYLSGPETRNYYLTYLPEHRYYHPPDLRFRGQLILTFTPLEDTDGEAPVEAEVNMILLNELDTGQIAAELFEQKQEHLREHDQITVCQHLIREPKALEAGKTYIMAAMERYCEVHYQKEIVAYPGLYTSETTSDGTAIEGEIPSFLAVEQNDDERSRIRIDAVSGVPDFMSPGLSIQEIDPSQQLPKEWVTFALSQKDMASYFPVLGANSTNLLPTFHSGNAFIADGRNITEEEFETGAKVCLIPQSWTFHSSIMYGVGKSLTLPLICTLSGYTPDRKNFGQGGVEQRYSLLTANGTRYSTFSYGNYEIVGTYALTNPSLQNVGKTELLENMIIVPQNSVAAEGANIAYFGPMNSFTTSFQIENGRIEEFKKAFRAAVPDSELLRITFDDNGYEEMKASLSDMKQAALLLLFVGIFAAGAMIALFLFFFVSRQKREIAIMRSLGAKKSQCRSSALGGILILSAAACIFGSAMSAFVLETAAPFASEQTQTVTEEDGVVNSYLGYDIAYSGWKDKLKYQNLLEDAVVPSNLGYYFVPAGIYLTLVILSVLLVNRYLRIDPIFLLSQKRE